MALVQLSIEHILDYFTSYLRRLSPRLILRYLSYVLLHNFVTPYYILRRNALILAVCYGARDTKILVLDLCSRGVTSAIRSGSSQDTELRALRGSYGLP